MLVELLAVTIAIIIVFISIYSNFFPALGEYESRMIYNNIDAQYSGFYARVVYLKMFNDNTTEETSLLTSMNSQDYITLVTNGECNSNLFSGVTGFNTSCNSYMENLNIEEIIFTKYNITELKSNYDGTVFKKYIKYLSKTSDNEDGELYRLLIKTTDGYTTMPFYSKICSEFNYGQWNYTVNDCSLNYRTGGTNNWSEWGNVRNSCNTFDTSNCETTTPEESNYFNCQDEINGASITKCVTVTDNGSSNCYDGINNLLCRANSATSYSNITIVGDPVNGNCKNGELMNVYRFRENTDNEHNDAASWAVSPCE